MEEVLNEKLVNKWNLIFLALASGNSEEISPSTLVKTTELRVGNFVSLEAILASTLLSLTVLRPQKVTLFCSQDPCAALGTNRP